jgi:hypothetical protein
VKIAYKCGVGRDLIFSLMPMECGSPRAWKARGELRFVPNTVTVANSQALLT